MDGNPCQGQGSDTPHTDGPTETSVGVEGDGASVRGRQEVSRGNKAEGGTMRSGAGSGLLREEVGLSESEADPQTPRWQTLIQLNEFAHFSLPGPHCSLQLVTFDTPPSKGRGPPLPAHALQPSYRRLVK